LRIVRQSATAWAEAISSTTLKGNVVNENLMG